MVPLPLANILHYRLRSVLSALGIGIAICMLLTLSGLARGTLHEVADRWEAVGADLIVFPRGWGDSASARSGNGLWDSYAKLIRERHAGIVQRVVPVFTWQIRLAGQDQMVAGVDADDWHVLTGGRKLSSGRLFDPDGRFARWIEKELLTGGGPDDAPAPQARLDLARAPHPGLEIVIDSRLARAGGYRVGDSVRSANHEWKIVGIVPAGAMTRVFMPRRAAQYLFGGSVQQSTLMFVKLRPGCDIGPAGRSIAETISQDVVPLASYRGMLRAQFGIMFRYVDAANAVALVIAFLFIMVTLYTMVLQRTRDIAILKSSGASDWFIVRQVLGESALLTAAGTAAGVAMACAAGRAIETFKPLYSVTVTPRWIGIAICAAAVGAAASAVYPAWQATRVDIAEALTLE